jgi:hypothetical protein
MKTPCRASLPPTSNHQSSRGMVRLSLFSLALLGGLALPLSAQDTPPSPAEPPSTADSDAYTPPEFPIDRYEKLRGKSPFEFELAKPVAQAAVDPFADLVLAGYAGSASQPTVYVVNTKTQERLTILPQGGPKKDTSGFKVLSINRGRNLATTTVKIEKDGVQKELSFDPKTLSSMTAGATGGQPGGAPGARPGMPGQPGQPMVRPTMIPGQPGQPPRFQAPQAFIPGQSNRNMIQSGANVAGMNGGGQVVNVAPATSTDAQAQLNVLLKASNTPGADTPPAAPTPGSQAGQAATPPPRRRVVLPNSP